MSNMGHAGLPADPAADELRQRQGLPVYRPTDPKFIDQTPYREYLAKEEEKVRAYQAAQQG
jgi:hypothetical protein